MPRTVPTATALVVLIAAAFASRLQAQVSPQFNVSINPSIVTVTQGSMASFTINIVVNERPQFEFTVSGLPGGIVAQVSPGHPGANTIMLTALPTASTGTFNVHVTALAGNNPQSQSFTLNVKPLLRLVLAQFFGPPNGFIDMVVQHVPSPAANAVSKVLFSLTNNAFQMISEGLDKQYRQCKTLISAFNDN